MEYEGDMVLILQISIAMCSKSKRKAVRIKISGKVMRYYLLIVCIDLRNIWETHSCGSYNGKKRKRSRKEKGYRVKMMWAIVPRSG